MTPQALSVADAIFSGKDLESVGSTKDTKEHPALQKVREKVEAELKSAQWPVVRQVLVDKLVESLHMPIVECLAEAYKTVDKVAQRGDRKKYPDDVTSVVSLGEHTVKASFDPHLAILARRVEIARLKLQVRLALKIQAALLEIRAARIMRLRMGTCQLYGEVALEGQTFYEKKSTEVRLPGKIDFDPGIEIPAR